MLVYTDIDLHNYQLQNAKVHVTAIPPVSEKGQIYLDSNDNVLKWHDGTTWRSLPTNFLSVGDNVSDLVNDAGYLTAFSETDPVFSAHVVAGIGSIDISNWNLAHGWGDHSLAGYISSYSEVDTLDSVTLRSSVTNNILTVGGLIINGNLTVTGTTTTINTEEILLADNIITLNSNATGSASQNAGLLIERGDDTNRGFRWNEALNVWEIQKDDDTYYEIATTDSISQTHKATISASGTITHTLNTYDITVEMYDTITNEVYYTDWNRSSINAILVSFYEAPTNPIRVIITKK